MNRFVINFNTDQLEKVFYDVVIVGAGISGLYTALQLPKDYKILILAKETYKHSNSYKAQGGIACVMNQFTDSYESHIEDTMKCGHYLNDEKAVDVMILESRQNIEQLIKYGVDFDKDDEGVYKLGMEGAHSQNRILHQGDTTGAHIMDVLYRQVKSQRHIELIEDAFVYDLLSDERHCYGVIARVHNNLLAIYASSTIFATGGIGKALNHTTNDLVATGDGIGMAQRAGVLLSEMNYLQYHPTVFVNHDDKNNHFLISEAVRGEGAIILDEDYVPLMEHQHPMKDLAPRDVVSLAIFERIKDQSINHVYLDMTGFPKGFMASRFPYIYNKCLEHGYDTERDYVPIIPMMHYHMGGIAVNTDGKTSLNRLYAVGECSRTGVHGKNRLASNSLLEAIVFGNKIANSIASNRALKVCEKTISYQGASPMKNQMDTIYQISHLLNQYFVTKRRKLLKQLSRHIKEHNALINVPSIKRSNVEIYNMFCVVKAICEAELRELEEKAYATKAAN